VTIINYAAPSRLLAIARGHPYEREAFAGLLQGLDEFDVCHVEQPAAQRCLGPQYAEIVGGRFHYREANLRGQHWPDSGYRQQVTHTVSKIGSHPVTEGIPERFAITDELYLCPVFADDVIPLLRSDYGFVQENFFSAASAVAGQMHSREGWSHPAASNLVGWVKRWGNSPIVYLQGGDDASAMANVHFRQLVHNAVRWVSSDAARATRSRTSEVC